MAMDKDIKQWLRACVRERKQRRAVGVQTVFDRSVMAESSRYDPSVKATTGQAYGST